MGGAASANGLGSGKFGCIACALPASVTANVIVNTASYVEPSTLGTSDVTTSTELHGVYTCSNT